MKFKMRVKFRELEQNTLKEWLEAFEGHLEEHLKAGLPEDYRNHMLEYNGGSAIGENVIFDADRAGIAVGEDIILTSFHYLDNGEGSLEREARRGGTDHIPKGINICYTYSGVLIMSLAQGDFGSVYHMHNYGEPIKIASSWTEFVSYLIDYDEDA